MNDCGICLSAFVCVWGFVVVFMEIEHSGEKKGALHP